MLSIVLLVGLFGHHHKPQAAAPSPIASITADPGDTDAAAANEITQQINNAMLDQKLAEMRQAAIDYPWLLDKIQPAVTLCSSLHSSLVTDQGYDEMMQQMLSDIRLVEKDELNYTI